MRASGSCKESLGSGARYHSHTVAIAIIVNKSFIIIRDDMSTFDHVTSGTTNTGFTCTCTIYRS